MARFAAVVFHWLRRERVFERDIFRFGTGTVLTSSQSDSGHWAALGKYPSKGLNLEIGVFQREGAQTRPAGIDHLMGMVFGKIGPLSTAIGAQP